MPIFRQDTKLLIDKGGLFSTIDISKVRDANSQYGIYTEAQHINREHFKLSVAKVRIISALYLHYQVTDLQHIIY